jgi:serine/threonine-protein kinase
MRLGRYRLVAELARGGMAVVWLAEARGAAGFTKSLVLKELAPELARDEAYRVMFLDEARVAARLSHRNIVQTIDVGCDDGRWYMVMELLEGCSLERARTLLHGNKLPLGLAVEIVREVLAGLHYAHEHGVVHRDVTAQNVFLTSSGDVKLLDFGLAKSRDRARRTETGIVKGSVAYLSPDHVAEATIDRRADVFAAGVLLRELVLGRRLWGDLDGGTIVRRLVAREIPAWPADARVPEPLRRICERAMAPMRGDRFATAAEMRVALDEWLAGAPRELGSLGDLGRLFDRELASERDRARCLLRSHPPEPPPPPVTLASEDLVSFVPPPPRSRRRAARFLAFAATVFLFVLGMFVDHQHEANRAAHATVQASPVSACD